MSLTYKLASFLGSPFVEDATPDKIGFSDEEKRALYKVACNNKVGLFFLQKLKDIGELSPLEGAYASDIVRYNETLTTAETLSRAISKVTDEFAIFKFLKPYPHTPSDVDVLFFLSNKDYMEAVRYLLDNGYAKIGESPSQIVVYDLRGGYDQMDTRVVGGKKGGKYYIDLYNEVSASHLIYLNKETLLNHRIKFDCQGKEIQTLDPVGDLAVVLTHSIIPEQLLTLGDYYTTLYYVKEMNERELDRLAQIFIENNVVSAGIASLSVISMLHEKVHGFTPDRIHYLIEKLGGGPASSKETFDNFVMPYRYPTLTLIRVILERMKNKKGLKSILLQAARMADPRLAWWVAYNIVLRRRRETY